MEFEGLIKTWAPSSPWSGLARPRVAARALTRAGFVETRDKGHNDSYLNQRQVRKFNARALLGPRDYDLMLIAVQGRATRLN